METIKKTHRVGQALSGRLKCKDNTWAKKSQYNFELSEAGILECFNSLEHIIDTRQNEYVRKRGNQLIKILKFSFAELLQQQELRYRETLKLKEAYQVEKEFVKYACLQGGIDPNFLWFKFQMDATTRKLLKRVDEKFKSMS